jgi:hypothetical protein
MPPCPSPAKVGPTSPPASATDGGGGRMAARQPERLHKVLARAARSDPHPSAVDRLQPSPAIPDHVDQAVCGAVGAAHQVGVRRNRCDRTARTGGHPRVATTPTRSRLATARRPRHGPRRGTGVCRCRPLLDLLGIEQSFESAHRVDHSRKWWRSPRAPRHRTARGDRPLVARGLAANPPPQRTTAR